MRNNILFFSRNNQQSNIIFDPIKFIKSSNQSILIKGIDRRNNLLTTENPAESIVKIKIYRDTMYRYNQKYLTISTLRRNLLKSFRIIGKIIEEFKSIQYDYNIVSFNLEILLNKPSKDYRINGDQEILNLSKIFKKIMISRDINGTIVGYTLNQYRFEDLDQNRIKLYLVMKDSLLNKFIIKLEV